MRLVLTLGCLAVLVQGRTIYDYERDGLENEQHGDPGRAVRGEYEWRSRDGQVVEVAYIADHLGFRLVDDLPSAQSARSSVSSSSVSSVSFSSTSTSSSSSTSPSSGMDKEEESVTDEEEGEEEGKTEGTEQGEEKEEEEEEEEEEETQTEEEQEEEEEVEATTLTVLREEGLDLASEEDEKEEATTDVPEITTEAEETDGMVLGRSLVQNEETGEDDFSSRDEEVTTTEVPELTTVDLDQFTEAPEEDLTVASTDVTSLEATTKPTTMTEDAAVEREGGALDDTPTPTPDEVLQAFPKEDIPTSANTEGASVTQDPLTVAAEQLSEASPVTVVPSTVISPAEFSIGAEGSTDTVFPQDAAEALGITRPPDSLNLLATRDPELPLDVVLFDQPLDSRPIPVEDVTLIINSNKNIPQTHLLPVELVSPSALPLTVTEIPKTVQGKGSMFDHPEPLTSGTVEESDLILTLPDDVALTPATPPASLPAAVPSASPATASFAAPPTDLAIDAPSSSLSSPLSASLPDSPSAFLPASQSTSLPDSPSASLPVIPSSSLPAFPSSRLAKRSITTPDTEPSIASDEVENLVVGRQPLRTSTLILDEATNKVIRENDF